VFTSAGSNSNTNLLCSRKIPAGFGGEILPGLGSNVLRVSDGGGCDGAETTDSLRLCWGCKGRGSADNSLNIGTVRHLV
jgi:hypothetical protein